MTTPRDCYTFNDVREWCIGTEKFIGEKIKKSQVYDQNATLIRFEAYHESCYDQREAGAKWRVGLVFTLANRSRISKTSKHIRNVYKHHGIILHQTKRRFGEPSKDLVFTFCIDGTDWYNLRNSYVTHKLMYGHHVIYGWDISKGSMPRFWGCDLGC